MLHNKPLDQVAEQSIKILSEEGSESEGKSSSSVKNNTLTPPNDFKQISEVDPGYDHENEKLISQFVSGDDLSSGAIPSQKGPTKNKGQ